MKYRFIQRDALDSEGTALKTEEGGEKVALLKRDSTIERVKPGAVESARLDEKLAKQLDIDFVKNAFVMTLSSDRIDRYRDIIRVGGWDLRDFVAAGGPLLLGHNSKHVIGHVPALWKQDGKKEGKNRLKGVVAFSAETDLARETLSMITGGQIRAGSVGFVPEEFDFRKDADGWIVGFDFLKQGLVEHSITATPANPDALIGKSADFPHFLRFMEERLDTKQGDDDLERAYLTIRGETVQVGSLGTGASEGVSKKTWEKTLERISSLEGRVDSIEKGPAAVVKKAEKDEPWLVLVEGDAS